MRSLILDQVQQIVDRESLCIARTSVMRWQVLLLMIGRCRRRSGRTDGRLQRLQVAHGFAAAAAVVGGQRRQHRAQQIGIGQLWLLVLVVVVETVSVTSNSRVRFGQAGGEHRADGWRAGGRDVGQRR